MNQIREKVEQAIRHHGSQVKLAQAAGCSQQLISSLLKAKSISADMAKRLDDVTSGAVSKHELRPDIFGPQPEAHQAPHEKAGAAT